MMSESLPTGYKKNGLIILILICLICLVVIPLSLYAAAHNSFKEAGRLLEEFIAYSGLGRVAALNHGQELDNQPPQHTGAATAEAQSTAQAEATPAIAKPSSPLKTPVPLQGVIHSWPEAGKMVALTFDDGPSSHFTPLYLKVLNEHGVHATFFLVGCHVQENPGLAAMIAGSGNEIGNHTFSHRNLKQISPAAAEQEITSTEQVIEQASNQQALFFRPPGGNLEQPMVKMINDMGLRIILWNIDPRDWEASSSPEHIINNVLANLQLGSIVILHEGKANTLAALPALIEDIKQRGYRLVTVSELLAAHDGPAQPDSQASPQPQPPAQTQPQSQTQPQTVPAPAPGPATASEPAPESGPTSATGAATTNEPAPVSAPANQATPQPGPQPKP